MVTCEGGEEFSAKGLTFSANWYNIDVCGREVCVYRGPLRVKPRLTASLLCISFTSMNQVVQTMLRNDTSLLRAVQCSSDGYII